MPPAMAQAPSSPARRKLSRVHQTPLSPGNPLLHEAPPSAWLLALESRVCWEFGALLPAWPLLARAVTSTR